MFNVGLDLECWNDLEWLGVVHFLRTMKYVLNISLMRFEKTYPSRNNCNSCVDLSNSHKLWITNSVCAGFVPDLVPPLRQAFTQVLVQPTCARIEDCKIYPRLISQFSLRGRK